MCPRCLGVDPVTKEEEEEEEEEGSMEDFMRAWQPPGDKRRISGFWIGRVWEEAKGRRSGRELGGR